MFARLLVIFVVSSTLFLPLSALRAFWGAETLSPKAERAKKVLEGFEAEIEKSLADYQIPGAAIGIVIDDTVVFSKGFGLRDCEKKLSVTPDTLFLVGSFTKAFTAFTVGCLVDEGLLGWDDHIVDLLPDFRLSDQYVTQLLTIRDLLSHQTPLPRHDCYWYNSDLTPEEVFHRMRYLDFANNPAEHFHYNNLMYLAVGMAIEKVTGTPWNQLVSEKILNPLQMKHTGFSIDEMKNSSNFSYGYIERNEKIKRLNFRDFSLVGPGACMHSSVTDLCQWIRLHLRQGEWKQQPLIGIATLKEMYAPQVVVAGYPDNKEEQVHAYGLGWYVQSFLGSLNIMHDGALDGFTSVISLLPQKDIGVVVMCNKNMTAWPRLIALEVFDRLLEVPRTHWLQEGMSGVAKSKELLRESKPEDSGLHKKGTSPSHPLADYVGEYEHPAYGLVRVESKDNGLVAYYNNFCFQLEHWHYDVFNIASESEDMFVSFKNVKVTFTNNINGEVAEIIIPFESKCDDISFKKKPEDSLNNTYYLRQFLGTYEIYSYTVEIVLRNHVLSALIPGQPMYELIPSGPNEFSIRSMANVTVRFVMDSNNKVQEVLLIQPYGIVYTAKPKGT